MDDIISISYDVPGDDFTRAGEASSDLKSKLKQMGVSPDVVRKVSIAVYEAEINMVIHANGGDIKVLIDPEKIKIVLKDVGPGIDDIERAMKVGYSTAAEKIRSLGFGAVMGLPNMKNYTDDLIIDTILGVGTTIQMTVNM